MVHWQGSPVGYFWNFTFSIDSWTTWGLGCWQVHHWKPMYNFDSTVTLLHLQIQPTTDPKQYFQSVGGSPWLGICWWEYKSTIFDLRLVEAVDVKHVDTKGRCIYWKHFPYNWTCTDQICVVQGSIVMFLFIF